MSTVEGPIQKIPLPDQKRYERTVLKYVHGLALKFSYFKEQPRDVLVVGSGNGVFANQIKEVFPDTNVVNLEPVEEGYEQYPGLQTINHDSTSVGLPDESFDLILCVDSYPKYFFERLLSKQRKQKKLERDMGKYDHSFLMPAYKHEEGLVRDLEKSFNEFVRLLKPGGSIRMYPLLESWVPIFQEMAQDNPHLAMETLKTPVSQKSTNDGEGVTTAYTLVVKKADFATS